MFRQFIKRHILRRPTLRDELESQGLRQKFAAQGISAGLYSYGCFDSSRINPGVSIGRYCSFSDSCMIFTRNHGIDFIGLTAYLYNSQLGVVKADTIAYGTCVIGDDVWIGHNAVILPSVHTIGRGAVIGAGAIVTRPVGAYEVVAGNPARLMRKRFADDVILKIEATEWWLKNPDELRIMASEHPDLVFSPSQLPSNANR